jgi:hypothetical protein
VRIKGTRLFFILHSSIQGCKRENQRRTVKTFLVPCIFQPVLNILHRVLHELCRYVKVAIATNRTEVKLSQFDFRQHLCGQSCGQVHFCSWLDSCSLLDSVHLQDYSYKSNIYTMTRILYNLFTN